uniref:Uncharacterized protein n=1 Tax=Arundo donax TaxID=35708 RepID=A0A0A9GEU0_ARUDO
MVAVVDERPVACLGEVDVVGDGGGDVVPEVHQRSAAAPGANGSLVDAQRLPHLRVVSPDVGQPVPVVPALHRELELFVAPGGEEVGVVQHQHRAPAAVAVALEDAHSRGAHGSAAEGLEDVHGVNGEGDHVDGHHRVGAACVAGVRRLVEVPAAAQFGGLVELVGDEPHAVHERHLAARVVAVVCRRVAHQVAHKVQLMVSVVGGDVQRGDRDGVAGVGVAADVERVVDELGVLGQPLAEEGVVLPPGLGEAHVQAGLLPRVREARTHRRVQEDDVAHLGPGIFKVDQTRKPFCVARHIELEGADLEEEAGEGRASWAAGDPQDEGVLRRVPLRLDEVVEEACAVLLVHLHVPCLEVEGQRAFEPLDVRNHIPTCLRHCTPAAAACDEQRHHQGNEQRRATATATKAC